MILLIRSQLMGEDDSEETGDAIDEEISDQTIPAALEGTFDEGDTLNETL